MVIRHAVIWYLNCFGTTKRSDDYILRTCNRNAFFFSLNTVNRTKNQTNKIKTEVMNICPYQPKRL